MQTPSRPNVLVYISHDTGRHISPYGVSTVHTPNAERLAAEGVVFDQFFCTAPQCSPSRAALFTGRYPHATGVLGLTHDLFAWDMDAQETHAAQHFHNLGYDTAAIGMTHEMRTREGRGFDAYLGNALARHAAANAAEWLDARADSQRPFYLQIATTETHRGYLKDGVQPDDSLGVTVPPYFKETPAIRQDFAGLQGSVRRWDEGLGGILRLLDERGLAEQTLLIVTTDHGIPVPRAKMSLYDPGIGVMLLMRWPGGGVIGGKRFGELLSNVDLLPTLLDLAGGSPTSAMQGASFAPLLRGEPHQPRDRVYAELTYHTMYDPMRCVRTDRYKYIRNLEMGRSLHASWNETYLPSCLNVPPLPPQPGIPGHHPLEELYDLAQDPLEMNNLAENPAYADVCAELGRALAEWMRDTGDPVWHGPVASPFYRRSIAELQQLAAGDKGRQG